MQSHVFIAIKIAALLFNPDGVVAHDVPLSMDAVRIANKRRRIQSNLLARSDACFSSAIRDFNRLLGGMRRLVDG
jgi:hypothetical protein